MNTFKRVRAFVLSAVLLGVCAAAASPVMEAASEASAADSQALNLQNVTSLAADEAEAFDLAGLVLAWSGAAGLDTRPFAGTILILL